MALTNRVREVGGFTFVEEKFIFHSVRNNVPTVNRASGGHKGCQYYIRWEHIANILTGQLQQSTHLNEQPLSAIIH